MRASKIRAVDFFDDLTSSYARRWFFGGFLLLVIVCLLLLYAISEMIGPPTKDVIISILVELISGSLIILAFYVLYIYFIGPNMGLREVSVVRPQDISGRMKALPLDVSIYMFWGRSGSFFRAYPLLELDRQATQNKHNIRIEVLLPDPEEILLVHSYRDILRSLGENERENPLLPNVIATCMACAIVSANNKFLEIRVHLSRFLPAFRLDLSDKGAILTQDDKKKTALFLDYGSEFYEMFRSTMINERDVSREVKWEEHLFRQLRLEEKSCDATTLNAFDIEVPEPDQIKQEVARLISERPHRYQ